MDTITHSQYNTTTNRIRVAIIDISSRTNLSNSNPSADNPDGIRTCNPWLKRPMRCANEPRGKMKLEWGSLKLEFPISD